MSVRGRRRMLSEPSRRGAALRMGRLRAAALRVLTEERIFLAEFDCEHVRNIPTFDWAFPASSSFYHLLSPKGGAKSVRRAKKSGNGRRLAPKTLRGRARARVFDGASAARSSSRFFAMRSLLCAARNDDLFRIIPLYSFSRPEACPIVLRK